MNKNKCAGLMPAIVFIIFIFSMGISFLILPKKEYSPSEKRYLAQNPELTADKFFSGEYGKEFEEYLSDQMTGRNFFVGLNSYYNISMGNNGSNGVYLGGKGYLINKPTDTDYFETNLNVIDDFAQKIDIPVTVSIIPSTGYIMKDKLPANHFKYNDEELFAEMENKFNNGKINFVNVTPAFQKGLQEDQVFYRTDHHYTSFGAYITYCELAQALDYSPAKKDEFVFSRYKGFYGTTYSTSGLWLTEPDTITIWNNTQDQDIFVKIIDGEKIIESDSIYFAGHLNEMDKYPVFIDGNHPYTEIVNKSAGSNKKLLVIKDSFAHCLSQFLVKHFDEIVMVDMRYYKHPVSELIEDKNIDQVLFLYGIDNICTDTNLVWLS